MDTLSGREQQYLAAAPALPSFAVGAHGDRGGLTPSVTWLCPQPKAIPHLM